MAPISQDQITLIIGGLIPLIVSNVLHMILVKRDGLASLKQPLHRVWFGPNKTLRGLIFVPMVNGFVYLCVNWPGGLLLSHLSGSYHWATPIPMGNLNLLNVLLHQFGVGAAFGLFYMVFELPNSWIKRRLGIAPGEHSLRYKWIFTLMDKTDSALGVSLIFGFTVGHQFNLQLACVFFVCATLLHFLVSGLLVISKIKKSF